MYQRLMTELGGDEAVYFADAVHPEYQTKPAYGWVKAGSNPAVPTTAGRGRVNIYVATELRPFFRTVSLLTLRGHFPSHIFKSLHRCLIANTGMPALSVVEDLAVFEDCSLGLSAGFEPLTVHQLLFQ